MNKPHGIRILHITDTHLFEKADGKLHGRETLRTLHAVLDDAGSSNNWPPNLILCTGDLVHDDSQTAYERLRDAFAAISSPVYCLPGNHDVPKLMASVLSTADIHCQSNLLVKCWQLIFLDTSQRASEQGHLSADELAHLERQLRLQPDAHTLICLHHNPIVTGSSWLDTMTIDNAENLFEVTDRFSQIRGILWGHVHQSMDQQRNGVRLLASPSTCVQYLPHSEDFALDSRGPGYRWLSLDANGAIKTNVVYL